MKELFSHAIKKVTLELIYQVVDERTGKTLERLEKIERRQEDDFRHLNDKIDTQIGQVRNEIAQSNQRIDTVIQLVRDESSKINQRFDATNQRIDTIIQMLVNIKKP
jgi:archaellum component FlaC